MGYIETMANVSVLAHDEPVSGECLAPLQKGLWSVGCTRKGQTAAAAVSIIRGGIVGASRIKKRGRPSIEDTNVPFSPAAPRLRGDRIVPEARAHFNVNEKVVAANSISNLKNWPDTLHDANTQLTL